MLRISTDLQVTVDSPRWQIAAAIVLTLSGLILAVVAHAPFWYSFFGPGAFLFLDSVNSRYGFSVLRHRMTALLFWAGLISVASLIEFVAARVLHVVYYPHLGLIG